MDELAVTGSTGRLGGRVARRLAADGVPQRLIVRDPARAPDLPGSTVARAEYRDGGVSEAALAGVRTLFMVSGSESPDRVQEHRTFVDAAKAAGVGHVVYVSFFAAAPDAIFTLARDHWATEQHIREAGLDFTFLRDNLYADFLPLMAAADGVIRGPAGGGRVSAVALDDITDVACAVLRSPEDHVGRTYSLTGPQALTLTEAADIMSEAIGTPYSFHNETVAEAYASRADYGAPDWQVDAWVSTYTAIAGGEGAPVTDDVQRLSGHPATTLAALLQHAARSS